MNFNVVKLRAKGQQLIQSVLRAGLSRGLRGRALRDGGCPTTAETRTSGTPKQAEAAWDSV